MHGESCVADQTAQRLGWILNSIFVSKTPALLKQICR